MVEESLRPGGFADLPFEILHEIFSYLDRVDLCKANRICRRWYAASRDPAFWKYVNVQVKGPQELAKLVIHLPPSVTDLRIRCKVMDENYPLWLADITKQLKKRCPSLELLMIEKVHFREMRVCSSLVKALKRDKSFPTDTEDCQSEKNVDECVCMFREVNQDQFSAEKMPPKLYVISLRNSVIRTSTLAFRSWQFVPQIKVLDLSNSLCITSGTWGFFHRLLGLRELYLTGCPITYKGIGKVITTVITLKVLDLESTGLTAEMFAKLTDGESLEELYIGGTLFNDSYSNRLQSKTFKRLRIICLRNTYATADGLLELTKYCRTIRNIVVSYGESTAKVWKNKQYKRIRKMLIYSDSVECPQLCDHFIKNHPSN